MLSTDTYGYGNAVWGDLLTSYNGKTINNDSIGNPTNWRGYMDTLYWEGRQLSRIDVGSYYNSYYYNENGIRTRKSIWEDVSGESIDVSYIVDGSKILKETKSSNYTSTNTLYYYYYDANGSISGFSLNGTPYYYGKNIQGDIKYIYNTSGSVVTEYCYDAWGNILSITGSLSSTVGAINPFRYRGYYYDSETGFYYLNSRYYDPQMGRFINSDEPLMLFDGETNLFACCYNNPIMYSDPSGMKAKVGNMGIINASDLPSGSYISKTITNASSVTWTVTSSYNSIAKNHCAAVAVTNLALYFYQRGHYNLMVNTRIGRSIYETFVKVHKIVGNGPVMTIAGKAKKYFKERGFSLKYSGANTTEAVKKAIDNDRPVGILIADGLFSWHWIICIGYRKYSDGAFYMQVVDGWNNSTSRYYKPHSGSTWISGTQYWI